MESNEPRPRDICPRSIDRLRDIFFSPRTGLIIVIDIFEKRSFLQGFDRKRTFFPRRSLKKYRRINTSIICIINNMCWINLNSSLSRDNLSRENIEKINVDKGKADTGFAQSSFYRIKSRKYKQAFH